MAVDYLPLALRASRAAFDDALFLLEQRITDYRFEDALARLTAADDQVVAALADLLQKAA